MIALIIKGKNKGKKVNISQWCNDWFLTMSSEILSPSALAFKTSDAQTIITHQNNGMLLKLFNFKVIPPEKRIGKFNYTFIKIKHGKQ